jgi:hypothetical protein
MARGSAQLSRGSPEGSPLPVQHHYILIFVFIRPTRLCGLLSNSLSALR